jgi:hypothetical protein
MIVMNPDKVSRPVHLCDLARKGGIGAFVVRIMRVGRCVLGSNVLPEEIMEQGPEN